MTFVLIIIAATLLIGVLIGYTFAERLLEIRATRQAAAQRALNSQWQALASEWEAIEAAQGRIADRESESRWSTTQPAPFEQVQNVR